MKLVNKLIVKKYEFVFNTLNNISESLPANTLILEFVFSIYFNVLSKFPLLSLIPIIFSNSINFFTVLKSILLPVLAGILYKSIGISTAFATALK